jgi:hypothetical protein
VAILGKVLARHLKGINLSAADVFLDGAEYCEREEVHNAGPIAPNINDYLVVLGGRVAGGIYFHFRDED